MASSVSGNTTKTKVSLSTEDDSVSSIEVSTELVFDEALGSSVTYTLDVTAIGSNPEIEEDKQVWLSIRTRTYASTGVLDPVGWRTLHQSQNLLEQHFSLEEAKAIVAVLSHEIDRLEAE